MKAAKSQCFVPEFPIEFCCAWANGDQLAHFCLVFFPLGIGEQFTSSFNDRKNELMLDMLYNVLNVSDGSLIF